MLTKIQQKPFYQARCDEIERYQAAYDSHLPVMIKGPTGCGKTRFIEYMAFCLKRPLVNVSCNEDMTASDLVGRYLLNSQGSLWCDGPLTIAARQGAICYLDEVVEARQDTMVIIHALTDHRRMLPLDKKGEQVQAHPDFQLVVSYNPGYQSGLKDLKPSTRHRFVAMDFDYPDEKTEIEVLNKETGIDHALAMQLVQIAIAGRRLKGHGLTEGISTRLLVYTAQLIQQGLSVDAACEMAIISPCSDDPDVQAAMVNTVNAVIA